MRILLAAGIVLALVAAAPEAEAGFRLSIGTGGFYFAVGHHDYYPYYHQPAHYGGYGASSFSFHNTLGDYGYWQYVPEVGMQVWIPYVEYGWRPYTYGHWAYSSYGWTWVSYEPWGWIPHHYGNWTYVDHYGWAWVPGYTWRPHCVNFAVVNGYIGWAPVAPPWYRYSYNRGYRYHGDRGWYSGWHHGHRRHDYSGIDYSAYVFVDNRNFYGTGIHQHALLPGRGAAMFQAGQVMPLGDDLQLDYVKRVSGHAITPVALDRQVYKVNGSEVVHYQPRGQEELVRQSALPTVNKALAPGFQKHGVSFKGAAAQSAGKVSSLFKQQGASPKTATFTRSAVSRGMASDPYYQKQKRTLENRSKTRAAASSSAAKTTAKTRTSSGSAKGTPSSGSSKSSRAVTSGYKPRTGVMAGRSGTSSSNKSRSVNRGSSSAAKQTRAVSKPPAPTRSASVPPRNRPTKPARSTRAKATAPRSKPPASTRTASVPPRNRPAKPVRTISKKSSAGKSRSPGKPSAPSAGKTAAKPSPGAKSETRDKQGKRN